MMAGSMTSWRWASRPLNPSRVLEPLRLMSRLTTRYVPVLVCKAQATVTEVYTVYVMMHVRLNLMTCINIIKVVVLPAALLYIRWRKVWVWPWVETSQMCAPGSLQRESSRWSQPYGKPLAGRSWLPQSTLLKSKTKISLFPNWC